MTVTVLLVSHDGARWLPPVLEGLERQSRPVDRAIGVDTGSRDGSADLLRGLLHDESVLELPGSTSYPAAVAQALEQVPEVEDEWVWLLHDDSLPAPDALEQLLRAAEQHPEASVLGPKLREWPSLKRLLEVGLTITGTGHRETGLERGEYDQGQHDEIRPVLAVNTAGMLVRRRVLRELGGLDPELPIFGNDIDFGWRAAQAGHTTLVVPSAVVFHAEAAHRGIRRTPLTGRHTHYQERRAALLTVLANAGPRVLPWQVVRLFLGSLLRVLGFLVVRSVGEALDELAAVLSVYSRPRSVLAARRTRAERRSGEPRDVRHLLAPPWLPYRHGLDFVTDLAAAATNQAQDVAERRRTARVGQQVAGPTTVRDRRDEDDEEAYLQDTGIVARFFTSPVAVVLALFAVLAVVGARTAFGTITGGALSPVPDDVASWWQLHAQTWHPLGSGTDVPAPAYVLPFAFLASLLGGPGVVVSALMLLAVPFAAWGMWRLLTVVGHLVDTRDMPRWLHVWGAVTYGLVPATSGAWGEGRFGTVAVAALLPWTAHAALGFADPDRDRRWRAAWRTALLVALGAAFVPGVWLFAVLATAIVLGTAAFISPRLLRDRDGWGPPVASLLVVPVLLAPWLVPLVTTGSAQGLLLEAGRLPGDRVDVGGLLTGRLGDLGAPWWLGALLGLLALLALVPRATRVPVLACWLVALAAAVVVAGLGFVTLQLPAVRTRPSLGLFVVILQGLAVIATALGAEAYLSRLRDGERHPLWQRLLAALLAAVAALVPLGGLVWWLVNPGGDALERDEPAVVPAYMEQSSLLGDEHGVLVLRGSVAEGIDYRILRGDGVTLGEDEVLALAKEDEGLTDEVTQLVSAPTGAVVEALGRVGIEYVVLPSPADGTIAAGLDATAGLDQASAEDRSTRAWRVDRPLSAEGVEGRTTWPRLLLLALQVVAVLVVLVLAAPTVRRSRDD